MKRKFLPIGIQYFNEMHEGNYIYVDKTKYIFHLAEKLAAPYFLSRPRRFGKSLIVSTLKELFSGRKDLFKGLWIENKWDWTKTNPVIHLSFDGIDYKKLGLEAALQYTLQEAAKQYKITLDAPSLTLNFKLLGLYIKSEVHSAMGRADSIVETPEHIFIFEFKFNRTAKEALQQIRTNQYAAPYLNGQKKVIAIGVNFVTKKREIKGWEVEELN